MFLASTARPHIKVSHLPTLTEAILALSPVAWWKLDEGVGATTALDYSGNGYNATYNTDSHVVLGNTPMYNGSLACVQVTSALNFAAATASVSTYPALLLGLHVTDAMTMACFVKETGGGATIQKCFGYGPLHTGVDEGLPDIQYRNTAAARGRTGNATQVISGNSTGGTVVFLAWTMAAGVSNNVWTLYENGTSVGTTTQSFFFPANVKEWDIMGAQSNTPPDAPQNSYAYTGYGSDFMLFNYALNSTQLTAIAHAAGLV